MGTEQFKNIDIKIGRIACSHNILCGTARLDDKSIGLFYVQKSSKNKIYIKRNPTGSRVLPVFKNKKHDNRDCKHENKPFRWIWEKCMLCLPQQHTTVKPHRNDVKIRNAGELIGTCKAGRDTNCLFSCANLNILILFQKSLTVITQFCTFTVN